MVWAIGMSGKRRYWRWLFGVTLLVAAEAAVVVAIDIAMTTPAEAQQYRDDRFNYPRRQRQRSGGFFQDLFGGGGSFQRGPARDYYEPPQQQSDHSRAPPPRKADTRETAEPTTSVVVMGDGLADWLAYGLEEAFGDSPDVGIVRKEKARSGLLRYQFRSDLDWWHVARDILSKEKANYVVMMLGVSDRQNIRERDVAKDDEKFEQDQQEPAAQNQDNAENSDQPSIAAPEPKPDSKPEAKPDPKARPANAIIPFRSDRWAEVYSRRIDETIAALKSKGVPVFWVGLPSVRGAKSTADAVYLNDLYRARATRAGIVYIDVWDGFVDEAGKYSNFGPDYEGQTRRLRSGDGVYFTRYGARKLAHYVEREIRRYMSNRALPVALPSGPLGPVPGDGKSVRPLAGPVLPLTVTPNNIDALAGGAGTNPARGDTLATQVLVKGQPLPAPSGRADDFAWPLGSSAKKEKPADAPAASSAIDAPVSGAASAPAVTPAAATAKPAAAAKAAEAVREPAARSAQPAPARARPAPPPADARPRPPQNVPQQRSQSPFRADGPLGWIR